MICLCTTLGSCHLKCYPDQSTTSRISLEATHFPGPHVAHLEEATTIPLLTPATLFQLVSLWSSICLPLLFHYHQRDPSITQLSCLFFTHLLGFCFRVKSLTWLIGFIYDLDPAFWSSLCDLPIPVVSEHAQLSWVVARNRKSNGGSRFSDLQLA